MSRYEKAKVKFTNVCEFIKTNNRIPKRGEDLYSDYYNIKRCFGENNTTLTKYDFFDEIANEYGVYKFFTESFRGIKKEANIKKVQDFIIENNRAPSRKDNDHIFRKYKDVLDTSHITTNIFEINGLKRLQVIINELLAMDKPDIKKLSQKAWTSLMTFKMTKSGVKVKTRHYKSYDELCANSGLPNLLDIKRMPNQVTRVSTKKYTIFYTETTLVGSHQQSFARMKTVTTYDIKLWLEKNNIIADYVIDGFHKVSTDWYNG